jgi:hypothetical protein
VAWCPPESSAPAAKPLAHRTPETTHQPLPGNRGFLRVVPIEKPLRLEHKRNPGHLTPTADG